MECILSAKQRNEGTVCKSLEKKIIEACEIKDYVIMERNILRALNHGMIMRYIKSLKDDKRIYFLLEYVDGVTLYDISSSVYVL